MSPVDSIKNERQLKANDEEEVWKRNGPVNQLTINEDNGSSCQFFH